MKTLFRIILILSLGLTNSKSLGQEHHLFELEKKLLHGDKAALFEIARYFDSKKDMTEFWGYHEIQINESEIAKRIIDENCIFTESEIIISDSLTSNDFSNFLNNNKDKITFSGLARAFIITPLESRTSKVAFRAISEKKRNNLKDKYAELLKTKWVKNAKIDSLIKKRDSKALLNISSELYKIRYRFNTNHSNQNEYTELLQLLLGCEIAVEDEKKELNWHIDKEFYPDATLNLLIYFSSNYSKFKWDTQSSTFKNETLKINGIGKEDSLFQFLRSSIDLTASDAFTQLTTCNSKKVIDLANEYEKAGIETNFSIPTFPYSFLKQLVVLTEYCKHNNIDYVGSKELKSTIFKIDHKSFADTRKLEDSIINNLSLEEITAFEYWAAIYEKSWDITYSSGRILDKFYSKHWNQIINDEQQLKLFLKKSYLFDEFGIIGICNNYLKKFINIGKAGVEKLMLIKTDDEDIKNQIEKAKSFCNLPLSIPNDTMKVNNGNRDYYISDIAGKIKEVKKIKDQEKMEDKLQL